MVKGSFHFNVDSVNLPILPNSKVSEDNFGIIE